MSQMLMRKNKIKNSKSDRIFYFTVDFIMVLLIVIVCIPVMNILASSMSSPKAINSGKVGIFPVEFTLDGYKKILQSDKLILGFGNTIFYTVVGTLFQVGITLVGAYPMSRKDFKARGIIMKIYTFTLYFSGGIIASYLLIKNLGLINSRWVMIIPNAFSVTNMIVMRTYFETNIPGELLESTKMDGCSDFRFLTQFVVPLSKPIVAVMLLFVGVGFWNMYFNAFLYLSDESKYPISLLFQQILGGIVTMGDDSNNAELIQDESKELLQYALIVVTTLPVVIAYPFVQKYFVKGLTAGAVKG